MASHLFFFLYSTCFYCLGLIAKTSQGADRLEELGWECVRHRGADTWPIIEQEITYIPMDYSTDEEAERSDSTEENEDMFSVPLPTTSSERFGGVYLGDDTPEASDGYPSEAFEYTRITFGEDKRSRTKRRNQDDDEEKKAPSMSNFQSRTLNVNDTGQLVEQSMSLYSGLERLVASSEFVPGIYFGDDSQLNLKTDVNQTLSNLQEQQMLRLSNTEPNLSDPSNFGRTFTSSDSGFSSSVKTRSLFDKAGIYLGEEEIEPQEDFTFNVESFKAINSASEKKTTEIENVSSSAQKEGSLPPSVSRTPRIEKLFVNEVPKDALGPIREADSSENVSVASKDFEQRDINISIEEVTIDSAGKEVTAAMPFRNGNDPYCPSIPPESFNSGSVASDISSERQSPVDMKYERHLLEHELKENEEDSRRRSTSLTLPLKETDRRPEERSASFSGVHSHKTARQRAGRTGSDPGITYGSRTGSSSSLDSDRDKYFGTKRKRYNNSDGRRKLNDILNQEKLHFENEQRRRTDTDERYRSGSDRSISPSRHKRPRKPRGSLSSLSSVSPAAFQVGSLSSVPASPMYTSARDAVGYAAWTTLRKQRGIRKELDSQLQLSPYQSFLDKKKMAER